MVVTFRARTYAESDSRLALLVPGGGEDRVLKVTELRSARTVQDRWHQRQRQPAPHLQLLRETAAEEVPCARTIAGNLAQRAFRRPLQAGEVDNLMQAYTSARNGRSFDEGVRGLVTRILASPDFLVSR